MKRISYVIALAAAFVAAGLIVPTAQAQGICVDEVTAGGWIPEGADEFANFGLNAREEIRGEVTELTGELNFVDADLDCHVVGQEVLSYTVIDEFCREIVYDVTLSLFDVPQEGEFEATVIVCDYGEPSTEDTFSIEVFDVTDPENPVLIETCSASGTLVGGNVQLHESGNCP
jgi:hypothetical protein